MSNSFNEKKKKQLKEKYLDELPVELLAEVTSNLDLAGLWTFSHVCRFFQEIVYRFTDQLSCYGSNYPPEEKRYFCSPIVETTLSRKISLTNFDHLTYWIEKTPQSGLENGTPLALFRGVQSVSFDCYLLEKFQLDQLMTSWSFVRNLELIIDCDDFCRHNSEPVNSSMIDSALSRCTNVAVLKTTLLSLKDPSLIGVVKKYKIPVWHVKIVDETPVKTLRVLLPTLVDSSNIISLNVFDFSALPLHYCSDCPDLSTELSTLVANNPLRQLRLPDICLLQGCRHIFWELEMELSVCINGPLADVVQMKDIRAVLPLIWSISWTVKLSNLAEDMVLLETLVNQGELSQLKEVTIQVGVSSSDVDKIEKIRVLLAREFLKGSGIIVRLTKIKSLFNDYSWRPVNVYIRPHGGNGSLYDVDCWSPLLYQETEWNDLVFGNGQLLKMIYEFGRFCQVLFGCSFIVSSMVDVIDSVHELCFYLLDQEDSPDMDLFKRFIEKVAPTLRSIGIFSVGTCVAEYFEAFFDADVQLGRILREDLQLSLEYVYPSILNLHSNNLGLGPSMLRRLSYSGWKEYCYRHHVETFPFQELLKRATSFTFRYDSSDALTCSVFIQLLVRYSKKLRYLSFSVNHVNPVLRKSFLKKELKELCNSRSNSLRSIEIISRPKLADLDKAISNGRFGHVRVYLKRLESFESLLC